MKAQILYIKYLRELILGSVSLLQALREVSNAKFYALNSLWCGGAGRQDLSSGAVGGCSGAEAAGREEEVLPKPK